MKLGCTGTQQGLTHFQHVAMEGFLWHPLWTELHNGDCIGADEQIAMIGFKRKPPLPLVLHPPNVNTKRANLDLQAGLLCFNICDPKDYLLRDQDIVNASEALVATPKSREEEIRSGTWYTVRYARKLKRPICIFYPDGTPHYENWEPVLLACSAGMSRP